MLGSRHGGHGDGPGGRVIGVKRSRVRPASRAWGRGKVCTSAGTEVRCVQVLGQMYGVYKCWDRCKVCTSAGTKVRCVQVLGQM